MSNNHFTGFPAETFHFMQELESNNNRDWFSANQDIYERAVIVPAQDFVAAFGIRARHIYPGLVYDTRINGTGSMFRMNRDTRFSKDKAPFKTNLGFRFWLTPDERLAKRVRLYVHLDKHGVRVYGGEHCMMEPDALHALREAIAKETKGRINRLLEQLSKQGFAANDEKLVRVPRVYPSDHPNADLLRLKNMFMISPLITRESAGRKGFIEQCVHYAEILKPLNDWLGNNLSLVQPSSKKNLDERT
ncbi:MAG: DUF2461 domain-containing protein [Pseudomonadota bacterium]